MFNIFLFIIFAGIACQTMTHQVWKMLKTIICACVDNFDSVFLWTMWAIVNSYIKIVVLDLIPKRTFKFNNV